MSTPKTIIAVARTLVNDTDAAVQRQTDTELLNYVNEGLKEISALDPDLFLTTGDYSCIPGETEQALRFNEIQEFVQVVRIKGGKAVHRTSVASLSAFNPNWAADAAGAAENWAPMDGQKLRFYIYPKAPEQMQVLEIQYRRKPQVFALNDELNDVPDRLMPALSWYVVFKAEMKDDEHAVSGRAVAAYTIFKGLVTGETPPAPTR